MNDYIALRVAAVPMSEDYADLLCDSLGSIGYESFETDAEGVTAYIAVSDFSEEESRKAVEEVVITPEKLTITRELIKGRDWNEEWEKHYFKPIVIGDKCVVHSTFHTDVPTAEIDIVIDPKMAFGTGHHSTTSLIIRRLLDMDLRGLNVIDMGTGTGILAILCAKRGAQEVTGIEIDPGAYNNAIENAELNGVTLNLLCGDVKKLDEVETSDLFIANINRNVILADIGRYSEKLKKGGTLLLSGFYRHDIDMVKTAAEMYGLRAVDFSEDNEWVCLELAKKS